VSYGTKITPESLLTPAEVAQIFRVDPKTVTRWAKVGKLTFIRTLGGHRRFRETEVRAILNGRNPRHTVTIEQTSPELRAAHPIAADARWAVVERRDGKVLDVPATATTRHDSGLEEAAQTCATVTGADYQLEITKAGGR
jgi:excisionase family DNA binding protein